MQGRHDGTRAILSILVLCTALLGAARAEPSVETIARGRALTDAADCATCHTADPAKPFAGGKRIGTPCWRLLFENTTTISTPARRRPDR